MEKMKNRGLPSQTFELGGVPLHAQITLSGGDSAPSGGVVQDTYLVITTKTTRLLMGTYNSGNIEPLTDGIEPNGAEVDLLERVKDGVGKWLKEDKERSWNGLQNPDSFGNLVKSLLPDEEDIT